MALQKKFYHQISMDSSYHCIVEQILVDMSLFVGTTNDSPQNHSRAPRSPQPDESIAVNLRGFISDSRLIIYVNWFFKACHQTSSESFRNIHQGIYRLSERGPIKYATFFHSLLLAVTYFPFSTPLPTQLAIYWRGSKVIYPQTTSTHGTPSAPFR